MEASQMILPFFGISCQIGAIREVSDGERLHRVLVWLEVYSDVKRHPEGILPRTIGHGLESHLLQANYEIRRSGTQPLSC